MTPDHHSLAVRSAARSQTDHDVVAQIVALRAQGKSFRAIAATVGRCMEGVRQVVMRYEAALSDIHNDKRNDDFNTIREPWPLPPGHPVAMDGLWRGLERWRYHDDQ